MDADADDHGHERIMLFRMDHHRVKLVMVQNPVVDPFRAGAVIIGIFPFLCSPGDRRIQPDVPFGFCMDGPSVRRIGAGTAAGSNPSQNIGAAPLNGMFGSVISPADHAVPGIADGRPILVNADGIRNGSRPASLRVQVNERFDVPFLKKLVSRIIIIGRIKADAANGDIGCMLTQFMECDQAIDRIMACSTGKTEEERKIHFELGIVVIQMVKGIAIKVLVQVGIPAEACIRVRIMAEAIGMGGTGA